MKYKLTDFELATIGSVGAVVADLFWLANDVIHAGRYDHALTGLGLLIAAIVSIYGWRRHKQTGSKPIQSNDDLDYRITLYMQKERFKKHCAKEKQLRKLMKKDH